MGFCRCSSIPSLKLQHGLTHRPTLNVFEFAAVAPLSRLCRFSFSRTRTVADDSRRRFTSLRAAAVTSADANCRRQPNAECFPRRLQRVAPCRFGSLEIKRQKQKPQTDECSTVKFTVIFPPPVTSRAAVDQSRAAVVTIVHFHPHLPRNVFSDIDENGYASLQIE